MREAIQRRQVNFPRAANAVKAVTQRRDPKRFVRRYAKGRNEILRFHSGACREAIEPASFTCKQSAYLEAGENPSAGIRREASSCARWQSLFRSQHLDRLRQQL